MHTSSNSNTLPTATMSSKPEPKSHIEAELSEFVQYKTLVFQRECKHKIRQLERAVRLIPERIKDLIKDRVIKDIDIVDSREYTAEEKFAHDNHRAFYDDSLEKTIIIWLE